MMLQKKSSSWARLKYAYILPLAAITVAAFARPEISQPFEEISSVKVSDFITTIDPVKAGNVPNEMLKPVSIESLHDESILPIETTNEIRQISTEPVNAENNSSKAMQPVEPARDAVQAISGDTTVYKVVEVMPEYPGGTNALMDFIAKNMHYPEQMEKDGIQGRVIVKFVVTQDGSLRDIEVVSSLHPEADAEAIRVIKAMPKWTPGKQKGKAVNVQYTVPLTFRIHN